MSKPNALRHLAGVPPKPNELGHPFFDRIG